MVCLKNFIISIILAAISSSPFALCNDSSSGDENGTIVFERQPDISMDKEVLFISEEEVRVDYTFTNTSKKDIQVPVTFPMPPIYIGFSDHNAIEEFKLWIDNEPQTVAYNLVVKLNNGEDISKKFAESGWSVKDVMAFVEDEKIPQNKPALPKSWFLSSGMPAFTMSNYYSWKQVFPAGKPINVRHAYRPSKSTSVPQPSEILRKEFGKTACIDNLTQAGIKKREDANGVNWSYLSYILVTANNWQGAIKDFDLTIKKKDAGDLMSLCFEGELKKIDPLTFKFHQTNYKPKENINILFVSKKSTQI